MTFSKKSWYTPKNTTHQILFIILITSAVSGLLIAVFRQQIHTSITEICHTISNAPKNTIATPFKANLTYQSLDPSTDDQWTQLVTPNGGFILEKSGDDWQVYGVGMFHQLHCLQIIRNHIQELYSKLDARHGGGMKRGVVHGHHLDLGHTLHCMDYFRQVFLCFADGSLEPSIADSEGGLPTTNGMVPHQCRDPSPLYEKSLASHQSNVHSKLRTREDGLHNHDH
ncbi:hypothetical protein DL98DRAFT_590633 [Cadophora sp. DSE1049]|nr:hypothetical protein DL98DRAFT_590633 [Cadophora sp. DSE1049]